MMSEGPISTAGVLPFADSPHDSMRYVLLGKEDCATRWYPRRWADFGGAVKAGETVEQAAAREFTEETMGCVPWAEEDVPDSPRKTYDDIVASLEEGDYCAKTVIHARRRHSCTFLKRVPWAPHAQALFSTLRGIADVVAEQPPTQLSNERCWGHPALRCGVAPHGGFGVAVQPEWAEKRCIRLWSLPQLEAVLTHGGSLNGEPFRPAFVATLKVILPLLRGDRPVLHGRVVV